MVVERKEPETAQLNRIIAHPLDPLSFDEIDLASSIVKTQADLGRELLFETIMLIEPPKKEVLSFVPGTPFFRNAFVVVLNYKTEKLYDLDISLDGKNITRCQHIPGVQPAFMFGDLEMDFN